MFWAALHMVISDFFHLRLGASVGGYYSLKVFKVFVALGPQVHLHVGGGGGTTDFQLSSKHKLWNFHRFC